MNKIEYSPECDAKVRKYTIDEIYDLIDKQEIISGTVRNCNRHYSITMNLGDNIVGIVELNDLELTPSDNRKAAAISKVGKTIKVVPQSIEKGISNIIVKCSRKEAQQQCYINYISKLTTGDIIPARAMKYETYGIFCDIGCGIVALLPTGKIRVPYIVNPQKENKKLKNFYAIVNKIDTNGRIELSHKELLGTWDEEVEHIEKGDVIVGKIISIQEYGYFVMISQNLQGLAEIVDKDISLGDTVSVKVLRILKDNKKIKLQIVDKIEDQPVFDRYRYKKTSGHIDSWSYFEGSDKATRF